MLLHTAYIRCTSSTGIKIAAVGQSNTTSFTLLPLGQSVLFTNIRIYEIFPEYQNMPNFNITTTS